MYIWLFSRSVGAGSATTRNTRGLTRSVIALMVPPLPAPSRPSNTMQTFKPFVLDPLLQLDQLDVQLGELLVVELAFEPVTAIAAAVRFFSHACISPRSIHPSLHAPCSHSRDVSIEPVAARWVTTQSYIARVSPRLRVGAARFHVRLASRDVFMAPPAGLNSWWCVLSRHARQLVNFVATL